MSLTTNAAFPVQFTDRNGTTHVYTGLNTRELFAAMAMQGLCAHFGTMDVHDLESTATRSVQMADALIAELAKPVSP